LRRRHKSRAAFDTIDHSILLCSATSVGPTRFGFTHTVYSWLQSYLIGRYQSVHIGRHSSTPTLGTSGVPQGSVLGPLLFSIPRQFPTSPVLSMFSTISTLITLSFSYLSPTGYSADITNPTHCLRTSVLGGQRQHLEYST